MALVIKDRVKETTATTGTGALTLVGASTGYQAFSAIGDTNTTYYGIVDPTTGDWEVGLGTYTLGDNTLARTIVYSSSNGGSLVSFGTGTKDVFATYPANKTTNPPDVALTSATTYTITNTAGSQYVRADSTSNSIAITMPSAIDNTAVYYIKKLSASNTVTINAVSAQTFDGGAAITLNVMYESVTLISNGTNWEIV